MRCGLLAYSISDGALLKYGVKMRVCCLKNANCLGFFFISKNMGNYIIHVVVFMYVVSRPSMFYFGLDCVGLCPQLSEFDQPGLMSRARRRQECGPQLLCR